MDDSSSHNTLPSFSEPSPAPEKKNKRIILFLALALLVIVALPAILITSNSARNDDSDTNEVNNDLVLPELKSDPHSLQTLIYGAKMGNQKSSTIQAVNDSGNNYTGVTELSDTIKSVIPLSNGKSLIYIAGTNDHDEGARIEMKDIKSDAVHTLYTSTEGYRIDYLNISHNNEWIIWYETKAPVGEENNHESNHFRSYKANISSVLSQSSQTIEPQLLKDEKSEAGVTIHLPAIVTNSGSVFFDGLKPAGYFLYAGITNESDDTIIPTNGYNGQPYLFNENYFLYTAYNPSLSPQLPTDSTTSARSEVINKNSLRFVDISTKTVTMIVNGTEGDHYNHPVYVSGTAQENLKVAVEVFEVGEGNKLVQKEIQLISYNPGRASVTETIFKVPAGSKYRILGIGDFPAGKSLLLGEEESLLGNLGSGWFIGASSYQAMLKSITILNLEDGSEIATISHPDTSLTHSFEFIGMLPKTSSAPLGIERNDETAKKYLADSRTRQQLQLQTFVPVQPLRERSNPRSECEEEWEKKGYPSYEACERCPIYVYSPTVADISIKPLTPLVASTAQPALDGTVWNVKADQNSALILPNGKAYRYIDFDFPRGKVDMPLYGKVISQGNYEKAIVEYAENLGLNEQESRDVYSHLKDRISKNQLIYLSHLKETDAKKLLDYEVSPKPDTKVNIMFYVKLLDKNSTIKAQAPSFSPFVRQGLTVVSWGAVVE